MVSNKDEENGGSGGDKKALSPPTEIQTALMQDLTPLPVQETSASTAREVTIKQVAPLVLVLTGATFLNVSLPPLLKTNVIDTEHPRTSLLNPWSSSFLK
jgi:hypothetical protein